MTIENSNPNDSVTVVFPSPPLGMPNVPAPHTRGPWQAMKHGTRWAVTADALFRGDVCRAQREADARLLAAAPDLLAALQKLLPLVHATHIGDVVAINEARAAIAKATATTVALPTPDRP